MNDIILQTKDLTKKYGNQTVLDHVNIQLKKIFTKNAPMDV